MPASLHLSGVAASFGARPLFAGLDATLAPGEVTAVVGPNGAGKTTLLRIIAGLHASDAGAIRTAPADATIGYLPQAAPTAGTILDDVRRRTGVAAANAEFEAATEALAGAATAAAVPRAVAERYDRALGRWLGLGAPDLEVRLAEVLPRVGLAVDVDRPLRALSGGQRGRAALASVLVSRFDVLLLDEPTNNLDADGLDLLTHFVRTNPAPMLVASHDRAFLDEVATAVIELDPIQQAVRHYRGGWSDYRAARELLAEQAAEAFEAYVDRREALDAQAARQTEWASRGRAKAAALGPGQQLAKQHKENKARRMDQRAARARDAARRLEPVVEPRKAWELRYRINRAPDPAEVVLTLDQVVVTNGDFTLGPFSGQVVRGDRVALVGPNGSGKSTLLAAITGERAPASGRLSWGTRVLLGVVDQERSVISGEESLLATVMAALDETDAAATRTLLAKFDLGAEHVNRPCHTLSLGERTRAALALLQGRQVNLLVLDEPTNHLDVAAIEQLQAALEAFDGTMLVVTHDRRLAEGLAPTATWTFPLG